MAQADPARERISQLIASDEVVLFMKGTRSFPQCGFSAAVIQILDEVCPKGYTTVNVLSDPDIRQGIKDYSEWPTIPQLYVRGEFVGGCDIVRDMHASGELHQTIGVERVEAQPPAITVTEPAKQALAAALADAGAGHVLHLAVNARWQHGLDLGPPEDASKAFLVDAQGVRISVARAMAPRIDGIVIDFVQGEMQSGFKIENPNAPASVEQITAKELAARIAAGDALELIDVRTPQERDRARIEGSQLLDDSLHEQLMARDRDTHLVFYCHHGQRSQQAAQHFLEHGFKHVCNVVGGIDAWSQDVDSSVPRY